MYFKKSVFKLSATSLKNCPLDNFPEFAFFGRSNVGKSTLINKLLGVKSLAKTSSTPGKTQHLNFYFIDDSWHLVDLPGYGYAKVSQSKRQDWETVIKNYLLKRNQLLYLFLLIDCRHEPINSDLKLIDWLGEKGVPFCIVFTKSDKISKKQLEINITKYKKTLMQNWEELPKIFVTSSQLKEGLEDIQNTITEIINSNKNI